MVEATGTRGSQTSPETGPETKTQYQPFILVVAGAPLHGKTTLATEMAARSNLVRLDVDEARAKLFPNAAGKMLSEEQERDIMLASYEAVHEQAQSIVGQGKPVVIAAAYTRSTYHEMLRDVVKKAGVPLKFILLECTEEEALARLTRRNGQGSLSNVTNPDQYRAIRARYEIMSQAILVNSTHLETSVQATRKLVGAHEIKPIVD